MSDIYNYYEAMKKDILDYITDNINLNDFENEDELEDYLNDELWAESTITGNGPDYYGTEEQCEEYLNGNFGLVIEACEEFCISMEILVRRYRDKQLARYLDATIRCYLLGEVIAKIVDQIWIKPT